MAVSRRGFLFGAGASLLVAPAIVRAASLMPVSAPPLVTEPINWVQHGTFTFVLEQSPDGVNWTPCRPSEFVPGNSIRIGNSEWTFGSDPIATRAA